MSEYDWQRELLGDLGGSVTPTPGPAASSRPVPVDTSVYQPEAPQPPATIQGAWPTSLQGQVAPAMPGAWPTQPQYVEPPAAVPTVDPGLTKLIDGKPRSGDSAARRAGRALRRLVGSSAAHEVEQVTRMGWVLQQPITTGRQIAVTSIRGGAGKTTVSALLGATFTHYRRDPVLMMEAEPALGSLPVRVGAPALRWTFDDLARVVTPSMSFDQIIGYLVALPEGGWLLPGSRGQVGARLELETFQSVATALRRYFAITVVDCECLPGELARSALAATQARVIVAPATAEGVTSTYAVLQWMGSLSRPLLPSTVVVLSASSPHQSIDLTAATAHLQGQAQGARVLTLPYDRHLAAGGRIHTSWLAQSTRDSAAELGAELLNRAVHG